LGMIRRVPECLRRARRGAPNRVRCVFMLFPGIRCCFKVADRLPNRGGKIEAVRQIGPNSAKEAEFIACSSDWTRRAARLPFNPAGETEIRPPSNWSARSVE
jgi:hypothetical protein